MPVGYTNVNAVNIILYIFFSFRLIVVASGRSTPRKICLFVVVVAVVILCAALRRLTIINCRHFRYATSGQVTQQRLQRLHRVRPMRRMRNIYNTCTHFSKLWTYLNIAH